MVQDILVEVLGLIVYGNETSLVIFPGKKLNCIHNLVKCYGEKEFRNVQIKH